MCEQLGIMYISSILRKHGHSTDIVQTDLEDYIKKINEFRPDVLAYSSTTGEHRHLININKEIKRKYRYLFSVFGGPHPTFFPEMINEDGVDAIIIGEGEYTIIELIEALDKKTNYTNISGCWIKKDKHIYKNTARPLVDDLDLIPIPDREIMYDHDNNLKEFGEKRILIGRGCPFKCTYCFNNNFSKIYGHDWNKVRKRSVDNVIKEVREIKRKNIIEFIRIVDDTFIMGRKEWLEEFSIKFKNEVNIPFFCNVRANLVTPEIAKLLKNAGCFSVFLAVETGDEEIRNTVLKRNMSDKDLFNACSNLRKEKIKYGFYNILCLPVDNAYEVDLKTLRLNIELKPDMAWSSIFTPFPKTEMGQYSIEHQFFDGNFDSIDANPKIRSVLDFNSKKEKRKVENLHKLFGITVAFPFLLPLTKLLIRLPQNRIYNIINMGWYGWVLKVRMSTVKVTVPRLFKWAQVALKHTIK